MKRHLPLLLLLLAPACGSTTVSRVELFQSFPPYPDDHPVEVFLEGQEMPVRAHVQVAELSARSEEPNWNQMLEDMKQSAREIGADALVDRSLTTLDTPDGKVYTKSAAAIRFTDR